jgi:hypothetical protein
MAYAAMGLLPTAASLGIGIWLVVAGRAVFGAALIAAAVVIEIVIRLWWRTLRRWTDTPE